MPDQVDRLVARGALLDEEELRPQPIRHPGSEHPNPVQETLSCFEQMSGLIMNLKHVLMTALKSPEQINLTERTGRIAASIQDICALDIDGALAAPCLDFQNPYIVVHQMMGAVLTEIIAKRKEISSEDRKSLVCAALTRDLGQIPIQLELDNHIGPLPDAMRIKMHQHPQLSAHILEKAGVTDQLWLSAVRGHHERLNGSGYPFFLREGQIPLGARILAIADIYSAMEKPRPYRNKAHFPQNALKEIYQKKDAEIDGEMAHILINQIGLLPPGTLVKLQCGEIAVIKSPTIRAEGATVFSIYGRNGMVLTEPIMRQTTLAGYEITSLIPYTECRSAAITIKRVWAI